MIIGIYQSLMFYIIFVFHNVDSLSVEIGVNVSGILGENGTKIDCSYTIENVRSITNVNIMAFNRSSLSFEQIAVYLPGDISILTPQGQYLKGRVTLTSITQSSTKAVMIFNKLMCIDDTFYKCRVIYTDTSFIVKTDNSSSISVQVTVTPSKPDEIVLKKESADSSVTTPTVPISSTTSSSSTAVTTKINETISTMDSDEQNDTTASTHSTLKSTDHNTTSSTPSDEDLFIDNSYRTTTYSIQQTTTTQGIAEGDRITIVCTGDVGKPAAKHVFKKYRSGQTLPLTYKATETSISEISENCSYYRTSKVMIRVTADDNNAVIRCVVNSSMAGSDMYVETKPIEVYYEASMPTITIYPNKAYYIVGEDTSILLTCKSDGNPKPYYRWYKENDNKLIHVSTNKSWNITDMNVTNSGVYTCNVSNTFNGDTYRNAKTVQIDIINKDDITTTQSTSTGSSSGAYDKKEKSPQSLGSIFGGVAGAVVIVIVIVIVCIRKKKASETPILKNESKCSGVSKSKPNAESRTSNYDFIAMDDDANKTQTVNNGHEVEDINKHNEEYLKKQEEEDQKKLESNTPPQPAVYAQVNEATKSRNMQSTETPQFTDKQEEDTYAETQEGIYDKAGDRRHKENENVEHFDSSKKSSNGDTKLLIQASQIGSYDNQAIEKDEIRKVATVSPRIRTSDGLQGEEQTNQSRNSQSKKGTKI